MGTHEKLVAKILSGKNDATIRFAEMVSLLLAFGFTERIRGSHHIFYKNGIDEILNIQDKQGQAKPYQVKQVRALILKYQPEERP